jgi:hypothetical protein
LQFFHIFKINCFCKKTKVYFLSEYSQPVGLQAVSHPGPCAQVVEAVILADGGVVLFLFASSNLAASLACSTVSVFCRKKRR